MTKIRPIEDKDREAILRLIEGTGAFKPEEVDVATRARRSLNGYFPAAARATDSIAIATRAAP